MSAAAALHGAATRRTLRALLRYAISTHGSCAVLVEAALPAGASAAASRAAAAGGAGALGAFILSQFRAGARLRGVRARAARSAASDCLAFVESSAACAALGRAYAGADADAPAQRRSAARFIGLDMPAPAAGPAAEGAAQSAAAARVGDKYRAVVEARTRAGVSKLTGLDAIKAQLYGVDGSRAAPAPAAGKLR